MAERQIGQLSFVDGFVVEAGRANSMLLRVSELVDWKPVETLLSSLRSGRMGAPAITLADGRTIDPEDVLGPPTMGKKLVVVGDAESVDGLSDRGDGLPDGSTRRPTSSREAATAAPKTKPGLGTACRAFRVWSAAARLGARWPNRRSLPGRRL
jgi:hypothetical protein